MTNCWTWIWPVMLGLFIAGCDQHNDRRVARKSPTKARRQARPNAQAVAMPEAPVGVEERADGSQLPLYQLKMSLGDLEALESNPASNDTRPAAFSTGGIVYDGVKVRIRGQWSRSWPKKSLKIIFNKDKLFKGHHTLDLNSAWRDPAYIREPLAYHVYAVCGAPAPKSRLVRLEVNGRFRGLYVEVEQPEKKFLNRQNLKGAIVFKALSQGDQADERDLGGAAAYRANYSQETQKAEGDGYDALQRFCRELQRASNSGDFFNRHVAVDNYINYLVATVLTQNWDCFNKNHFLVYDNRETQKWLVVPWDLDRTFGDHWNWRFNEARLPVLLGTRQSPGITGWNRLADRFLGDPVLRARFLDRLEEMLEKEFTTEKLFPIIDRLESEIAPEAALDRQRWPGTPPDFHNGIAQVRSFIERRRAYLLSELPKLRRGEATPGATVKPAL